LSFKHTWQWHKDWQDNNSLFDIVKSEF
jgi:hypothetical protein